MVFRTNEIIFRTNEIISYKQNNISYKRNNISYKRNNISYKRNIISNKRNKKITTFNVPSWAPYETNISVCEKLNPFDQMSTQDNTKAKILKMYIQIIVLQNLKAIGLFVHFISEQILPFDSISVRYGYYLLCYRRYNPFSYSSVGVHPCILI